MNLIPLGLLLLSLGTGQLESAPSVLPWIKQEEEAYEKNLRETTHAYLCSGQAQGQVAYLGL